ncbi:MAG: OprO/OprP family phosphate-selective porin [Gammaproteobacteria bacterium]|nr:OprO/OprP family phosphate-selective porin [Gammaproteobacteria bacterium]NNF49782.1 porin [Woeseiaceae bacterium]MBT8094161.1 OprO/OprP family phosphate-selective porin [Gammaproteobacteria bacterium]MBT8104544.1 OprO/OprP family phosphate-selective porin [Gammaproteobacteria bacterium]NNK24558.1 porin [Woeseiaceae bacterium]
MEIRQAVTLGGALLLLASTAVAQEAPPTLEEIWDIVQRQQAEIEMLRRELAEARQGVATSEERIAESEARIEATGDFVESLAAVDAAPRATSISGYGELHYNNISAASGDTDEIDFHRFVLFFGHEFTNRIRFFSEFELEHSLAGDGKPGEVELEQAYVEYSLDDDMHARTGLFLVPVGILNETHEPPTFYGVERNDVESIIIPSTWWEAGVGIRGNLDNGLSWDAAIHSGLAMPTEGGSAFRVRSGRQKVAEAIASDMAATLRLRYTGIAGLDLSASYQYQSDPSQLAGDGLDSGQLFTAHAIYEHDRFGLRALYGQWSFDGDAVEAADVDRQTGWYIEPSFRLNEKWGLYARYEDIDAAREQDRFKQSEFGFNYWPTEGVVLKMDFRSREFDLPALGDADFDAFDLGFGYSF